MRNEKVYIIVLNYNGWQDTIECLNSLYNLNYPNYQVIVCDNASMGKDIEEINDWAKKKINILHNNPFGASDCLRPIKVIEHNPEEKSLSDDNESLIILKADKNNGFSAGNNMGIRYARLRGDYGYLWILNNDTIVDKNSLVEMVKVCDDEKADGVGTCIRYYDKPHIVQLVGSNTNYEKQQIDIVYGDTPVDNIKENIHIDNLPGPSFLLTKSFVDKIKFMDEKYFLYCEEPDLGERAKRIGAKFTYAPKSYVYHKGGKSTGQHGSGFRDYHLTRSWAILLSKFHPEGLSQLRQASCRIIRKRMKHLHIIRALSVYRGYRDGCRIGSENK